MKESYSVRNSIKNSPSGRDISIFLCGRLLDKFALKSDIIEGSNPSITTSYNAANVQKIAPSASYAVINLTYARTMRNANRVNIIMVDRVLEVISSIVLSYRYYLLNQQDTAKGRVIQNMKQYFGEPVNYIVTQSKSKVHENELYLTLAATIYNAHNQDFYELCNILLKSSIGNAKQTGAIKNTINSEIDSDIYNELNKVRKQLIGYISESGAASVVSHYYSLLTKYYATFVSVVSEYADPMLFIEDNVLKGIFFLNLYKFTSLMVVYGMPSNYKYNSFEYTTVLGDQNYNTLRDSVSNLPTVDYDEYLKIDLSAPKQLSIVNDIAGTPVVGVKTLYSIGSFPTNTNFKRVYAENVEKIAYTVLNEQVGFNYTNWNDSKDANLSLNKMIDDCTKILSYAEQNESRSKLIKQNVGSKLFTSIESFISKNEQPYIHYDLGIIKREAPETFATAFSNEKLPLCSLMSNSFKFGYITKTKNIITDSDLNTDGLSPKLTKKVIFFNILNGTETKESTIQPENLNIPTTPEYLSNGSKFYYSTKINTQLDVYLRSKYIQYFKSEESTLRTYILKILKDTYSLDDTYNDEEIDSESIIRTDHKWGVKPDSIESYMELLPLYENEDKVINLSYIEINGDEMNYLISQSEELIIPSTSTKDGQTMNFKFNNKDTVKIEITENKNEFIITDNQKLDTTSIVFGKLFSIDESSDFVYNELDSDSIVDETIKFVEIGDNKPYVAYINTIGAYMQPIDQEVPVTDVVDVNESKEFFNFIKEIIANRINTKDVDWIGIEKQCASVYKLLGDNLIFITYSYNKTILEGYQGTYFYIGKCTSSKIKDEITTSTNEQKVDIVPEQNTEQDKLVEQAINGG